MSLTAGGGGAKGIFVGNCGHGRALIFSVAASPPVSSQHLRPSSFFFSPLFFSLNLLFVQLVIQLFAPFGDRSPLELVIPLASACTLPIPLNKSFSSYRGSNNGAMVVVVTGDQGIMVIATPIRHKSFTCQCQQKWPDKLRRPQFPSS